MKVGIKKVLTEALSAKVPPTVGAVMVASGLFELTKEGTKAIIDANKEETPSALEVENNLLKSEIITLRKG